MPRLARRFRSWPDFWGDPQEYNELWKKGLLGTLRRILKTKKTSSLKGERIQEWDGRELDHQIIKEEDREIHLFTYGDMDEVEGVA
jgi:hypothetical protein